MTIACKQKKKKVKEELNKGKSGGKKNPEKQTACKAANLKPNEFRIDILFLLLNRNRG